MDDQLKTCHELTLEIAALKKRIGELEPSEATRDRFYQSILEDMPLLVRKYLPDYTISYVNTFYCNYFGKTAEELIGASFLSLIPEEDHEAAKANISLLGIQSMARSYEHHVEDYVASGTDLTKQLLGFARGGRYDVKPLSMNEIAKKSSAMFGRTKKEVSVHEKYANFRSFLYDEGDGTGFRARFGDCLRHHQGSWRHD